MWQLVTAGGLAVLLDARIGGTLHAGGFSTTNIAVASGVAFTVTQGGAEHFGISTTGSTNVASATGQVGGGLSHERRYVDSSCLSPWELFWSGRQRAVT
jgi:hypothetical protein